MIWLTWRQFRAQAIAAAAALVVLAVIFGVTGPRLAHLYDVSGLATCRPNCAALTSTFVASMKADAIYPVLFIAGLGVLYLTPALIGLFWGAPLVTRELEAGTFRLAWNQSVTRTRWMAVKLALIGLAAMVTTGLLSLLNLRRQISYQPASRYWAFQWLETAIFAVLALALAGFCVLWIRHRRLA